MATILTQESVGEEKCMFWKLPPEVGGMIYDLVYGEAREVRVVCRTMWKEHLKHLLGSLEPRPIVSSQKPEQHFRY